MVVFIFLNNPLKKMQKHFFSFILGIDYLHEDLKNNYVSWCFVKMF